MSRTGLDTKVLMERIRAIERELEFLKRELIRDTKLTRHKRASSLYGSVKGGDITEEMIEQAKRSLFRDLEDL